MAKLTSRKSLESLTTETLSPFAAYQQRKAIEAKIAALQKESKKLKSFIESGFRANQVRLADSDTGLILERTLKTVAPFQNPGYSYYVYTLTCKGEGVTKQKS